MIAATNSYFDGITTHDGSIIMAHPGCNRTENGNTVTGRGRAPAAAKADPNAVNDCTSNLANINVEIGCGAALSGGGRGSWSGAGARGFSEEARHRYAAEICSANGS